MRSGNVLFSAVHLTVVLFVLSMGGLLLAMPYTPKMRYALADLLSNGSVVFFYAGWLVLSIGTLLLVGFYFLNRKRYFQVKMQCSKAFIDEEIIREYVSDYWKGLFKEQHSQVEVVVHPKQRLEIISQIPRTLNNDDREEVLGRIQNELGVLLARRLGYEDEFILTLSET